MQRTIRIRYILSNCLFKQLQVVSILSEEERSHGTISLKTYYHYFKAGGGYVFTIIVLAIFVVMQVRAVYKCTNNISY